ncbi:MAG: hypothetical protein AAF790_09915, partial [Planctomycetota bacterium]
MPSAAGWPAAGLMGAGVRCPAAGADRLSAGAPPLAFSAAGGCNMVLTRRPPAPSPGVETPIAD